MAMKSFFDHESGSKHILRVQYRNNKCQSDVVELLLNVLFIGPLFRIEPTECASLFKRVLEPTLAATGPSLSKFVRSGILYNDSLLRVNVHE